MMTGERILRTSESGALAVATLGFIKQTAIYEQECRRRAQSGELSQRQLLLLMMELSVTPADVLADSKSTINACLEQLGGLDYFIDDKMTGRRVPCTYLRWQGVHPLDQQQHLWEARFPTGVVGLIVEASFVDELTEHLQTVQS